MKEKLIDRRTFVKAAGAAGAVAAASGVSVAASKSDYDQVLNVVDDLGADPNGGNVDSAVQDNVQDNTLLVFPDGEYRMSPMSISGASNFGMAAADGAKPTIVADGTGGHFFTAQDMPGFLLEGLTFDFQEDGYGGRIQVLTGGGFTVRDVKTVGTYPHQHDGFRFDVRDSSSTGLVEHLVARGGVRSGEDAMGIYVGEDHGGELIFRNCVIEGFSNNGIYASGPGLDGAAGGVVKVEGGLYKNNNIAGVRLGTAGSYAKDVTVVVDGNVPAHPNGRNARGIWIRDQHDITVDNCDIVYEEDAPFASGAIPWHVAGGGAHIKNTRICVHTDDVRALRAKTPRDGDVNDVLVENVSITGKAAGNEAVLINDRSGTQFRNCCIDQSGSDRDGICMVNSDGSVTDCSINVTGQNVVAESATVDTSNITSGGSCQLPDTDVSNGDGGSGNSDPADGSDGNSSDGSGSDGSSGDTSYDHTLFIEGAQDDVKSTYEFTVTGELAEADVSTNSHGLESHDSLSGSTATGKVINAPDTYAYNGEVTAFDLTNPDNATVKVDGTEVDPATLGGSNSGGSGDGSDGSSGDTDDGSSDGSNDGSSDDGSGDDSNDGSSGGSLDRTIAITGESGTTNESEYEFTVSGDVAEADVGWSHGMESDDAISGSTATGKVINAPDTYVFDGEVTDFSLTNPDGVTVTVDGTEVDPATLGGSNSGDGSSGDGSSGDTTEHTLFIEGAQDDVESTYEFTVTGELAEADVSTNSHGLESHDAISGATATGKVINAPDTYTYTGEITAFDLTNPDNATVKVDGTEVDPATLGGSNSGGSGDDSTEQLPNLLVVDSAGRQTTTNYRFEATGKVAAATQEGALEDGDSASSGVIAGTVTQGDVDAYRFSGDVVRFNLDGSATVNLEDNDG